MVSEENKVNDIIDELKLEKNRYLIEIHALREELNNCNQIQLELEKSYDDQLSLKNQEIYYHTNSIRYRLGGALIDSTKSLKMFIKLPFILYRLFREKTKR